MTDGTGETIAQYGAWLTDEVIWYDIMPSSSFITNIIVWRLHLPKRVMLEYFFLKVFFNISFHSFKYYIEIALNYAINDPWYEWWYINEW